jgi:hypothetical protein
MAFGSYLVTFIEEHGDYSLSMQSYTDLAAVLL